MFRPQLDRPRTPSCSGTALVRALAICLSTGAESRLVTAGVPNGPQNLVIIVLAIAVAVLGSLYDESQQQRVVVDLPNLKIEAK